MPCRHPASPAPTASRRSGPATSSISPGTARAPAPTGRCPPARWARDFTEAEGAQIARSVGLGLLSSLRDEIGSLDRVTRVVKVLGMVNCPPEFNTQHKVIDGCSDLFVEVFGQEIGRHARSAVGMGSLPLDFPVEIEVIVEVAPDR